MPETTDEREDLRPKAEPTPKTTETGSTIRLFTREPDTQIPIHLEIVSATANAALNNLEKVVGWLKLKRYVPHEGFAQRSSGGKFTGKPASNSSGVACPLCKGEMWDNRAKKSSGEYQEGASDFTCKKDKDHKFNMEDGKLKKHWSMTKNEQPEYDEEPSGDLNLPFE